MTYEEYLRNRLDRLNQNSHYGIMIDTEITDIVRSHIKRLEETKMKATSVQTIENVKEMNLAIEKYGITDDITKVIVGVTTNDDIFEFHFSGDGCVVFADQWFNAMTEKVYKQDWESEKNKRQMMETANKQLIQENKDLKKRYDRLNKKFNRVMNNNLPETPITDAMIVNDYNRLAEENKKLEEELDAWKKEAAEYLKDIDKVRRKKNEEINNIKWQLQQVEHDKKSLTWKNEQLKKELGLEEAANEAQRKFITLYAGKGTEVQFNYAIDETGESSYVIVEKERYQDLKKENGNLKQENEELKYQLGDIQTTKEVVDQKPYTRAGILDQAKKCVCGQREQDYGTPESNFQLIADLWNDYLKKERLGRSKTVVDAVDVSMMMSLLKIARIRNGGGSGDSFVDLAGYAACGGEIWHGQKAKDQN